MRWWKISGAVLTVLAAGWLILLAVVTADRLSAKKAEYWDNAAMSYLRAFKNAEGIITMVEAEWKGPVASEHTQPIKTVISNVEKLLTTVPNRAKQRVTLETELANAKRILAEAESRK